MGKYIMVTTDEQVERSKARRKDIESLEYNPSATTAKKLKSPAMARKTKYIADVSIKRLTSRKSLYMHRFWNK